MNPMRAIAEGYVLRCIGELDAESESRVITAFENAPYESADQVFREFEAFESVTVAQVEWIEQTWADRKAADPRANPREFAAEVAGDVFPDSQ